MILHFRQDCLSIKEFDDVEVPSFTVLTGINGSGKSHLLEAIVTKKVEILGLENPKIIFFNYETFKLENEGTFNAQQISQEREGAWNFFIQPNTNIKGRIEQLKGFLPSYIEISKIAEEKGISLWDLTTEDLNSSSLLDELNIYKKAVEKYFRVTDNLKEDQQANSILSLIKKLPITIDELKREEFTNRYKPFNFRNDFLPQELGKIMWDYYSKLRENEVNEYQNYKHGKNYPFVSEEAFINKHGEKPWVVINKILDKFNSLDYRINSPEGLDHFGNFKVELSSQNDPKIKPEFSQLSSGERVLMALVASIYKTSFDKHFPDILLLDEIDASLHPSMIKNLLEVILDIFVKKDVKVFLVTHSPTTIALAPDEAIYVVNKKGRNRIEKKPKADALSILTEGFATLDEGLRLFDQISQTKVSIITEGKNTLLIKKALELYEVTGIEVITGAESNSGENQLKTLFQFFCKVPHAKTIFFVWDCDVSLSQKEENKTIPFVFARNANNKIALKGIENLFPENLFKDFVTETRDSLGVVRSSFDGKRKMDFTKFVLENGTKQDFILFEELISNLKSHMKQSSF